jgi:hypothetical protein
MSSNNLDRVQTYQYNSDDSEDITPFVCSRCATEVLPEAEPWPDTCPTCERSFDQDAQLAYSRGQDAFTAGQELIFQLSPKLRKRNLKTEAELEGLHYYLQAYTALQVSFKGDLAKSQLMLGVEMMAAMTNVILQHDLISPLESAYWSNLLLEMNSYEERRSLQEMLKSTEQVNLFGSIKRLRWRIRLVQLERALTDLDKKIRTIERSIAFVDPPRVRGRVSNPGSVKRN